ncbi:MAG: type II toxin-antitoxin system CcdA family antitoxin [Thermofilaceae archaeon]
MGSYVTVSTKVRRELKEEAEKLGINVSMVLRKALEEEVRKRRQQKLLEKLEAFRDVLDRIEVEELVRLVREDRERR